MLSLPVFLIATQSLEGSQFTPEKFCHVKILILGRLELVIKEGLSRYKSMHLVQVYKSEFQRSSPAENCNFSGMCMGTTQNADFIRCMTVC